jgi:hypothetical protein
MADTRPNHCQVKNIWYGMIHRTTNEKNPNYPNWGGRGIRLCERWHSFDSFYEDMGFSYLPGLSIERIDNNGDYCPENCKWATKKEQANNRKTNRFFTIDGTTKTLAQWIEISKLKPSTVRQRLYVYGWSVKESLGFVREN